MPSCPSRAPFGFGAVVDALAGFPSVSYCAHTIVHHLSDYGGQRYKEIGYSSAIAVVLFPHHGRRRQYAGHGKITSKSLGT